MLVTSSDSYRISDPMLFYKNVCSNVTADYTRDQLDSQLKSEFLTALQPGFARISELGIRYSALPGHAAELAEAMNQALSAKWSGLRGISIVSVGVNAVNADPKDEQTIKTLQRTATYRNANMAGAAMVDAQAEAMKAAASNENGAMMGFMGVNMAQQVGGLNANALFQMGAQAPAAPQESWKCSCGAVNTGKFCTECGEPMGWKCSCGSVNRGNFCPNCGAKKPVATVRLRCDKCGWELEDPSHPPKFCPNCGAPFDESDKQ